MKVVIRRNVFETNSSSMHSVVISQNAGAFSEDEIRDSFFKFTDKPWFRDPEKKKSFKVYFTNDYYNDARLSFERGPFEVLYDYADKVRYYIADHMWTDDEMVQFVQELKARFPYIEDIIFSDNKYKDKYNPTDKDYGLVDHQSSGTLHEFLHYHNIDKWTFFNDKKYVVLIDGDEYQISTGLYDIGMLKLDPSMKHVEWDGLTDLPELKDKEDQE